VSTPTRPTVNGGQAALALRLAGASYDEIASALGFADGPVVQTMVEAELARYASDADPSERNRVRTISAARMERLLRGVWRKATDEHDPEHLAAVRVAMQIIDRHTRLYGADAPSEVVIHSPTASEIDRWVATVLDRQQSAITVEEDAVVVIEGEVVPDERGEPAA
jgi:hypothetical protein